ncbi:PAS domain-containing sensor histidine kinase [Crocinitomix algicola]|uniref:PAS domain-containing sensor histidine kinase n=1 Tax=Crocinitomix algicola TaxID=1740263 RepID=UPI000835CA87|nr:PAS domain S-box protein [Crocinitomix algicola]
MRKSQIDEISDLLLSYSAGDYHVKGEISENVDEIDMIISGINMLGEELLSTNVSKEYFSSIFNTVTDMVVIADENGVLNDVNQSIINHSGYEREDLLEAHLSLLLSKENQGFFKRIQHELKNEKNHFTVESEIITKEGIVIYGLFTCAKIFDRFGKFNGYLISVKDITEQKEHEKLILKTILSTQSAEQSRVADDLHDSLGQELSMAQLMISNFKRFKVDDPEFMNLIELCDDIMGNAIKRLREICFDLMPNVLVKGGVKLAVETLVGKLKKSDNINVDFVSTENFPRLFSELEIVMYRIIQEFINNMIKHSTAKNLEIRLVETTDMIEVFMKENGQGFDMAKLVNVGENRGISNIGTKVKAFNGQHELKSEIGVGTSLQVKFPKI